MEPSRPEAPHTPRYLTRVPKQGSTRGTGLAFRTCTSGKVRNAFCCGEAVKRDDLTDMIAAAVDRIPRVQRGLIGLYLLAVVIVVVFIILLSSGG